MSTIGWIVLVVVLVPALGIVLWVVLSESFIRIPSGRFGLLLVRGRPTDTTLGPGVHFVPAIRRRLVVIYPSVELSYRAGGEAQPVDQPGLDSWGPPVTVVLGDRTGAVLDYSVRFRLLAGGLRTLHERLGPGGIPGAVRDESATVVTAVLGEERISVDSVFGADREEVQQAVSDRLSDVLAGIGIELVSFRFRSFDLGRTGEAIQAAARARHELAAEQATAATRAAQLDHDRELARAGGVVDPWRYRETELWRELVQRRETLNVTLPIAGQRPESPTPPAGDPGTGTGPR